jgi:hypothetical protein
MSYWFYQISQETWEPERFRIEIWENERWSWTVRRKANFLSAVFYHQRFSLREMLHSMRVSDSEQKITAFVPVPDIKIEMSLAYLDAYIVNVQDCFVGNK